MVGSGRSSISLNEIQNKISNLQIVNHYFGITYIPCLINSPLRIDNHPSLGLYSVDGERIKFIDFSTRQKGDIFDLLGLMWGTSLENTLNIIYKDLLENKEVIGTINISHNYSIQDVETYAKSIELHCKIRQWKQYDIDYWESYGITLDWLQYADVYPISHKIIIKDGITYTFSADKYAYAYVERKEGKITLKIYQPYNKDYKWSNKHDASVISLWTKVPLTGEDIVICSSLKDALCLWSNTGIPAIAIQGEGYNISTTALQSLQSRYKNKYIFLDNDPKGLFNGNRLSELTGFTNIILPTFNFGKDISDYYNYLYKSNNTQIFKSTMLDLLKNNIN